MTPTITLSPLDRAGIRNAQIVVTAHHYLHRPVDARTSVEGYAVRIKGAVNPSDRVGVLLVGRPEATRCGTWYGSVEDVIERRCEVTRWQVLNLSRVWLHPDYNGGGRLAHPGNVPGFTDRRGMWRSTLASEALRELLDRVGYDYLMRRPPCFPEEPFEIVWLLSYCDTRLHRGTIYAAAGFELYRTNERGIQTWRRRLRGLAPQEYWNVLEASERNERSRRYRAQRAVSAAQIEMGI